MLVLNLLNGVIKMIKVTRDNFVWRLITQEQAEIIHCMKLFDLYELRDDESESLIETFDEIKAIFENGNSVGIEVGFVKK